MKKDIDGHWIGSRKRITYLGEPVHEWDATTKFYVDEKLQDCLKLDAPKNKFDVGGNPLTGLPDPQVDSDAVNLKYFKNFGFSHDDLNKTLDDFATVKYVDDEIIKLSSKDPNDDASNPKFDIHDYYTSDEVDTHLKDLKSNMETEDSDLQLQVDDLEKDLKDVESDVNDLKNVKYFMGACTHNNEWQVEFPRISSKPLMNGNFDVSQDGKTLTIKEAGVWEITLLDQVNEKGAKRIEMIVDNADIKTNTNSFYENIKKVSRWETFYFSRILPLKANATIQIKFEGKKSNVDVGFDGEVFSKIIVKKYL